MGKTNHKNGLIAIAVLFVIAIACSFIFKPTSVAKEKTFQKEDSVTAICKELCIQNGYTEYRVAKKEKEKLVIDFFPNECHSIDHWVIYPERERFYLLEREW